MSLDDSLHKPTFFANFIEMTFRLLPKSSKMFSNFIVHHSLTPLPGEKPKVSLDDSLHEPTFCAIFIEMRFRLLPKSSKMFSNFIVHYSLTP